MGVFRRCLRRSGASRPDQAGFTIIEVVVAMAVVAITISASIAVVVRTNRAASDGNARVVASDLASGYVETARTLTPSALNSQTFPVSRTVNGRSYTVAQTVSALSVSANGTVTTTCGSTASAVSSYLVSYGVTWNQMAENTQPVHADTIISSGTTGAIAVQVNGASGQPTPGVTVRLDTGSTTTGTVGSAVTGSNGCAVFVGLAPGTTYTVSVNQAGYVGTGGTQLVTSTATVAAQQVTNVQLAYDYPTSLAVQYVKADGTGTVSSSTIPQDYQSVEGLNASGVGGTATVNSTGLATIGNLWPSTYQAATGPGYPCGVGRYDLSAGSTSTSTRTGSIKVPTAQIQISGLSTFTAAGPITATDVGANDPCPQGTTVGVGTAILFLNSYTINLPLGDWQVKVPSSLLGASSLVSSLLGAVGLGGLAFFCVDVPLTTTSLSKVVIDLTTMLTTIISNLLTFSLNGGCS